MHMLKASYSLWSKFRLDCWSSDAHMCQALALSIYFEALKNSKITSFQLTSIETILSSNQDDWADIRHEHSLPVPHRHKHRTQINWAGRLCPTPKKRWNDSLLKIRDHSESPYWHRHQAFEAQITILGIATKPIEQSGTKTKETSSAIAITSRQSMEIPNRYVR